MIATDSGTLLGLLVPITVLTLIVLVCCNFFLFNASAICSVLPFVRSLLHGALELIVFQLRLYWISPARRSRPVARHVESPTRLLIVLGSGGHTAELLNMLQNLPTSRYSHRTYVVSSGDSFSAEKAATFEATLEGLASLRRKPYGSFDICDIPRARRVHQSVLTSPFSVISCFFACVHVLGSAHDDYLKQIVSLERSLQSADPRRIRGVPGGQAVRVRYNPYPDLILTNGPATGLVMVAASLWLRFFGLAPSGESGLRSIFVESWARVSSLSLTGKIMVATGMCERAFVQWESLKSKYDEGQVEYIGSLVK